MTPAICVKTSVCPCGYPVLNDDVPVGTIYQVDWRNERMAWLHCGGCGTRHRVRMVLAQGRLTGQPPGYLPSAIFKRSEAVELR